MAKKLTQKIEGLSAGLRKATNEAKGLNKEARKIDGAGARRARSRAADRTGQAVAKGVGKALKGGALASLVFRREGLV